MARRDIMEESIWITRRELPDGRGQKDARQKDRDFMWYLWCGRKIPSFRKNIKIFERTYVLDENTWFEQSNPYYKFYHEEKSAI